MYLLFLQANRDELACSESCSNSSNGKSLRLPAIRRRKGSIGTRVAQLNAGNHFPNMVLRLSNIREHCSKPTSGSYTFQPLMSYEF